MTTAELAAHAWHLATRAENPMPVGVACEWLTDRADVSQEEARELLHEAAADALNEMRTPWFSFVADSHSSVLIESVRHLRLADMEPLIRFFVKYAPESTPGGNSDAKEFGSAAERCVALLRQLPPTEATACQT